MRYGSGESSENGRTLDCAPGQVAQAKEGIRRELPHLRNGGVQESPSRHIVRKCQSPVVPTFQKPTAEKDLRKRPG